MKKIIIIIFSLLFVLLSTSCSHEESFQKIDGFQMLDFRGNFCYYIDRDFFITKFNARYFLMEIDNNGNDDIIIYEGTFKRFSKINNNFVAIENVYEVDSETYDEYALIYLPDDFKELKDAKIEKEYDLDSFKQVLKKHELTIEKWEKA